ncbi:MAG TPA: FMN-binding negative transcriptional regulator [Thermomicrobiales bacterium]|jgi:transcriptional regulator|nr:FMN-binding negative transcriptional regulator [Thermomicrobiales bacterium]
MYRPEHFAEDRVDRLHAAIDQYPLGLLVTVGAEGLVANPVPFLVDPAAGPFGTLHAHVARANPVWREPLVVAEVMVVFQGPDAYVSPTWYPSKAETHRTVPTWNYLVVQAHGPLIVHDDVRWLRAQAGRLTRRMERDEPTPWKMADAPRDYTDDLLAQIVGIEIPITRIRGKSKLGQNRTEADRDGAAAGLRRSGQTDLADLMTAARSEDRRE